MFSNMFGGAMEGSLKRYAADSETTRPLQWDLSRVSVEEDFVWGWDERRLAYNLKIKGPVIVNRLIHLFARNAASGSKEAAAAGMRMVAWE